MHRGKVRAFWWGGQDESRVHKEIGASAAAFQPLGTGILHGLSPTHPHSPEDFGLGQVSQGSTPPGPSAATPEGWRKAVSSQVRCLFLALTSHASSCLLSVSSLLPARG